jgi:hypothetical protein
MIGTIRSLDAKSRIVEDIARSGATATVTIA